MQEMKAQEEGNVLKNFNLATGFDLDLKGVSSGAKTSAHEARKIIWVGGSKNPGLGRGRKKQERLFEKCQEGHILIKYRTVSWGRKDKITDKQFFMLG